MSAKASPLTTNSKRKFDELYYDDHKNTSSSPHHHGGTPKKQGTKNKIERASPPDKRVKKQQQQPPLASKVVEVLSSDSSSYSFPASAKKVNRQQTNDESNYSPCSTSSKENSCDTKEGMIFIKKESSALHPIANELSDDPSTNDSDDMPCISHRTVSLKRPQGFVLSTKNNQTTQMLIPPIAPSHNGSTTPKSSNITPTTTTSTTTPSQTSNVSQKKTSASPFSLHFPNLTRCYLSSPRDTKSPLSTPIKTPSQISAISDDIPSPSSVKIGSNHQATLPILSKKPKKFPMSYSQKIGQCIWTPLESSPENEGMLEEYELFCLKTMRDQENFLPDRAFEILHTFDKDIKQAKRYVKEHPKQITRKKLLTVEQEAKLFKAFNEFYLYKGSLRTLHRAVLPEMPYFDLVNYFFIYKKEESKVPPKLSKIVRNGLIRAAARVRGTVHHNLKNKDSEQYESSDDESCPDSGVKSTICKKENPEDSIDEVSDSDVEEKHKTPPPKTLFSNSNHIKSQTPQSTFCLSDSEEDVSLQDHEYGNDLVAQYSNHDASSQEEDQAYIPIENEDSTSTTEVFNFENNEIYDNEKKEISPPSLEEKEVVLQDLNQTTPLNNHHHHHHDGFNEEDVLDCSSPKPKATTGTSTLLATTTPSRFNKLDTFREDEENKQLPQQYEQPIMMKFVVDDETGKLVQAAIDEEEIQEYLNVEDDSDYSDDEYDDDDDEYDLGDQLEREFLDHVLEESMKSLDILSPVKPPAGSEHVFDYVTGGAQDILEKQLDFQHVDDEEVLVTDFNPGIVKCIPLNELESAIKESSSSILMDVCMAENSIYYTVFQSALKRFYLDVKRFLITQSYRKKQNDPSLQVSSDEDEIKKKCYEVQPSLSYLNNEIYDNFVPKSSQKDDILSDREMIRIAQQVIKSKEERSKLFSEWSEECDKNIIAPDTKDEMDHFDNDPNDPEYENASNTDEIDELKRFKTHGAHIRRIKIGEWSPTLNYDGQFLLKASPLLQKIYYKLFTYSPKYHIRPENFQEKDYLECFIVEASASKEAFNNQVFREFDRFKVSHTLWMEIDYTDVVGVHLQKASIPKSIQDHPLGLLVFVLSKKPKFFTRRVACTDQQLNTLRERSDFTNDKQASLYNRHYIIGDYRELKRVLSVILHSDTSGRLSSLYREGMENIFETEPVWTYDPSEDEKFIDTSKDTIEDEKLVRALPDEEGFFESDDEEEEALYELEYNSDIGEFEFKNLGTTYQYSCNDDKLDELY